MGSSVGAKSSFPILAGFLLVALAVLLPALSAFKYPSMSMDEAFLLEYPTRILSGALPNRDFMAFHGPGNYYLIALLYKIFGPRVVVERAVGLFYHLAIALALVALSLRWGRLTAITAGLISAFMLAGLSLLAFSWLGVLAFFLWSLFLLSRAFDIEGKERGWPLFIAAGFLCGLAICYRLETTPVLLVSTIPLLLLASWQKRFVYAGGLIVGLTPLTVHSLLVTPAVILANLLNKTGTILAQRAHIGLLWTDVSLYCLILPIVSALIVFGSGVRTAIARPQEVSSRTLLSLGLFCIGIIPQEWQWPEWNHILQVGCVTFGFLPTALTALAAGTGEEASTKKQAAVLAIVFTLAIFQTDLARLVGGAVTRSIGLRSSGAIVVNHQGRECIVGSPEKANELNRLLAEVDKKVPSGGRVFVFPKYPVGAAGTELFLYFLLPKLEPASYWMYIDYDSSQREKILELAGNQLAKDLISADALILWAPDKSESGDQAKQPADDLFSICPAIKDRFSLAARFGPRELYLLNRRQTNK